MALLGQAPKVCSHLCRHLSGRVTMTPRVALKRYKDLGWHLGRLNRIQGSLVPTFYPLSPIFKKKKTMLKLVPK